MAQRTEPVKNTCPDINSIIATITSICKQMGRCDSSDDVEGLIEDIQNWKNDLENIGVGKFCEMETLRDANYALRTWGYELVEELENLEGTVSDLESELAELTSHAR